MGASHGCICCGLGRGGAPRRLRDAPVRVTIMGAGGQIGYSLLPMIARGDMFGLDRRVILQCLDLNVPNIMENMRAMQMEIFDGNFPLVSDMIITPDDALAFRDADYAVLLGSFVKDGDPDAVAEKNLMIFRSIGKALQRHAKSSCKVLVAGKLPHINALFCSHFAPKLQRKQFFTLGRLDQNRAAGILARRVGTSVGMVKNVLIWGLRGTAPDISHAEIKGQPAGEVFSSDSDKQWLQSGFVKACINRGAEVMRARKASSAIAVARAIVNQVRDLHLGTKAPELSSVGVWSEGNKCGLPEDVFAVMPVRCLGRGRVAMVSVSRSPAVEQTLEAAARELVEGRRVALKAIATHEPS